MSAQIQKAVMALNSAFANDPLAVRRLLAIRVRCNLALANHPTAQVAEIGGRFSLGFIGLLNCAIEAMSGEKVAAVFYKNMLHGFSVYSPKICPNKKAAACRLNGALGGRPKKSKKPAKAAAK